MNDEIIIWTVNIVTSKPFRKSKKETKIFMYIHILFQYVQDILGDR